MKKNKKIMGLGLVTILLLGTLVACTTDKSDLDNAADTDIEVIEEPKEVSIEGKSNYVDYKGKVIEVLDENGETQVTVEGDTVEFKNIKFNITDDTVFVSDKSKDIIEKDLLKEGDTVEVFYDSDAPMTRSLPPMTNAKAIVVREAGGEDKLGVQVTKFNEDLISEDKTLQLNETADTVILDMTGKELTKEDMVNKEVVVFYGPIETASLPGQSNAVKVIVLTVKS